MSVDTAPTRHILPVAESSLLADTDTSFNMLDRRMSSVNESSLSPTVLVLRQLPRSTTLESLKTMLLFAKDLQSIDIVPSDYESDQEFTTAVARFSSARGAHEVQVMLDGKPNMDGQATMMVELLPSTSLNTNSRRNTMDPTAARNISTNVRSQGRPVRIDGPLRPFDSLSPPPIGSPSETALLEGENVFADASQAKSPNFHAMKDIGRISGKTVIGEETGDDETDGLLKDPVAYMKNDAQMNIRKTGMSRVPAVAFGNMSLNTTITNQGYSNGYSNSRSTTNQSPFSPSLNPWSPAANPYVRHNFPPVNPADQNPPCNTLYVGNLPMDTSEDELKAMFSKQRGYKRLCFRTKQNGPMCFVEFEDISFATKALNELYGAQLHNSVKGGIRLSFSKNPLGVRSGQAGVSPSTPLSPLSSMSGAGQLSPGSFSTASGPPPGLSVPPGFHSTAQINEQSFFNPGLGVNNTGLMPVMRSPPPIGRSGSGASSKFYPGYMMGR